MLRAEVSVMKRMLIAGVVAGLLVGLGIGAPPLSAITGAIYTTGSTCSGVNGVERVHGAGVRHDQQSRRHVQGVDKHRRDLSAQRVGHRQLHVNEIALSVSLASFGAKRSSHGVVVSWRTGTEARELGFNVYRQRGTRRVRVNRRLIPTIGSITGASYRFTDRRAPRHTAVRYYLQDVSVSGARAWHGPVRVGPS